MINLSQIKTVDLLNELASRPGIEKIVGSGKYSSYELRRKYSNNREELNPDVILIVDDLDHLDA